MRNFREFQIWIEGRKFVNDIYNDTDSFPSSEKFGLTSQLTRAAVSIVANIAEGASRKSEKDFRRFLEISLGSAFEVETLLIISYDRKLIEVEEFEKRIYNIQLLQKRISSFMARLN